MGEPLKIERIKDMSWLSWLEHVITEASLMTRCIRLHSIPGTYELDVFSIAGLGGLCPPSQKSGVLGGSAPQPKSKKYENLKLSTGLLD